MFSYTEKYTESESDIQNYNLFYKNTKKAKTLSKKNEKMENFKNPKISKIQKIIWYYVHVP